MRHLLLAWLVAVLAPLGLLAGPAAAQTATAKLYSKLEGDVLLVTLQVTPELGCWVYHDDADSGGKPTVVTLGPASVEWSPVWLPEPKLKADPIVGQAKVHDKKFVMYAVGRGADLDPAEVTATIDGQVCNERMCLLWSAKDLESRGAGAEAIWEGFPAALLAQGAAASAEAAADTWQPTFRPGSNVDGRALARLADGTVTVVIELAVAGGHHIYHGPEASDVGPGVGLPTVPKIEGGDVEWGAFTFPEPHVYDPGFGLEPTNVHEGRVVLRVQGEVLGEFDPEDVRIQVDGQVCDDKGCLLFALAPPIGQTFGPGEGPAALFVGAAQGAGGAPQAAETAPPTGSASGAGAGDSASQAPGNVPPGTESPAEGRTRQSEQGLLQFLLLAMGAGIITLLMPCTYPMIPITISFFTKQAIARGGNVLGLALLYGFGIVAIFVLIGALMGPLIVSIAQGWPMNLAIGVLFVVFALSLFGLINLQPPAFLMNAAGKASQTGGYLGVFMMGACLVITSFTCTAPFVGTLLGAGAGSSFLRIVLGMAVFGLTMATPFVFLALVPGKLQKLPQAGGWMETLKVFMGFVELAAALKFFSNADIVLSGGNYVEGDGWLSRELFLMSWAAIALVAALYLFGRINLKGESPDGMIGPGRLLAGTASVLFAGVCWLGVQGYQLGGVMTALAPPPDYTGGLVPLFQGAGKGASGAQQGATVVKDDYDKAVSLARSEGKLLLANFTGHT